MVKNHALLDSIITDFYLRVIGRLNEGRANPTLLDTLEELFYSHLFYVTAREDYAYEKASVQILEC